MTFARVYSPAFTGGYFAGLASDTQLGSTPISDARSGPVKKTTDSLWVEPRASRGGLTTR